MAPDPVDRAKQVLESNVLLQDILPYLVDLENERLKTVSLVTTASTLTAGTLPYNSEKVFAYAQKYCSTGNDCPNDMFDLDCTHFMCHCLAATDVVVTNPSAKCARELCIRVNDLAAAFSNAIGEFSNIKRISSHSETRRGDFCFIPSWFGLSKEHVMLLAGTASSTGAEVYAHTINRCGRLIPFEGADCAYYRIENV